MIEIPIFSQISEIISQAGEPCYYDLMVLIFLLFMFQSSSGRVVTKIKL